MQISIRIRPVRMGRCEDASPLHVLTRDSLVAVTEIQAHQDALALPGPLINKRIALHIDHAECAGGQRVVLPPHRQQTMIEGKD